MRKRRKELIYSLRGNTLKRIDSNKQEPLKIGDTIWINGEDRVNGSFRMENGNIISLVKGSVTNLQLQPGKNLDKPKNCL